MVSDSAFEDKLKELEEWIKNHKWLPEEIGESENPWQKYELERVFCMQTKNDWTYELAYANGSGTIKQFNK